MAQSVYASVWGRPARPDRRHQIPTSGTLASLKGPHAEPEGSATKRQRRNARAVQACGTLNAVPDPIFADPRLVVLYDTVDDDRSDLDLYERIVDELEAQSVLDLGCGTGTLACRLAPKKIEVVGVDPAAASLDVARRKLGGDKVHWVQGDAASAPALGFDLAVMTSNVAQVFVTEADWHRTLGDLWRVLRGGGWLVFEGRDPQRRAWETWTKDATFRELEGPGDVGRFETWTELVEVAEPLVSFRHVFRFERDGSELVSESTIRFRTREEILAGLEIAAFHIGDVRDAPDRPDLEFVFLAQRPEKLTT